MRSFVPPLRRLTRRAPSQSSTVIPDMLELVDLLPIDQSTANLIKVALGAASIALSKWLVMSSATVAASGAACGSSNAMSKPMRVALSGSGFRLCAHLDAPQACADSGYEVIEFAGTSVASIPIVFAPVAYESVLCVDGACADNLPAGQLTVDEVPRIGIYLQSDNTPRLLGATC
jgi:hypothetical protein